MVDIWGTAVNISGDTLGGLTSIYLNMVHSCDVQSSMTVGVFVSNFFKDIFKPIMDDVKQRNLSAIQSERIDYFNENFINAVNQRLKLILKETPKELIIKKEKLKWLIQGTEAALLDIQNEYETKKMPYLVNLYANLLFENIDHLVANKIIRLAQELTYQQMLIVACIALHAESKPLTTYNLIKGLDNDLKAYSITSDLMELNHKGIVYTNGMLIDINNFVPSSLYLKGCGEKLYNCLELHNINQDKDYKEIEDFFL